jgi:transcriptional regulator with XRE-family HTH domain
MLNSLVAAAIRSVRLTVGMSQVELAERMGYESSASISNLELGRAEVTMEILEKFCGIFSLEPDEVIRGLLVVQKAELRIKYLTEQLREANEVANSEDDAFVNRVIKNWEERYGN